MRYLKPIIFLLMLVFSSIILIGCTNEKEILLSEKEFYNYFDTRIRIRIWDENKVTEKQWDEIEDIIKHIQITFKREAPTGEEEPSELYLLNQGSGSEEPIQVSDDLYEVIKIGLGYANKTGGKLNPAIGPLVDLWDVSGNQVRVSEELSPDVPTQEEIDQLMPLIDYRKIILNDEDKTVVLPEKGMVIDLGAIAKGFAADKISEYFETEGFKHGLINLGGNILGFGTRYASREDTGNKWGIGIRDPKSVIGDYLGIVYVENKTVVSSGTYERYFYDEETDEIYHHILDTDTGYPVNNELAGVSIITSSSTKADALSTAVFAYGLDLGMEFIEEIDDTEAIFITKDNTVYKTSSVDSKYNYKVYS